MMDCACEVSEWAQCNSSGRFNLAPSWTAHWGNFMAGPAAPRIIFLPPLLVRCYASARLMHQVLSKPDVAVELVPLTC